MTAPGRAKAPLAEVARVFLKLGVIGFGGPAVHVAMMRDEMVTRRAWLSEQEFIDVLGATSVLPGPGSTQMAIYLGRRRAGWRGLVVGGACFVLPAMAIVLGLAWAYVHYGTTQAGAGLLYGIKPVVIAVVVRALWGLGRTAIREPLALLLAAAGLALYLVGANVLVVLVASGLVLMVWRNRRRFHSSGGTSLGFLSLLGLPALFVTAVPRHRAHVDSVFWEFLELGAIVFGSGYVLLAFLRRDLVQGLGWLSLGQLLDAVAVGQLTPGPVFTTATFIGYLVAGVPGALVATVGIFLPSFLMVALLSPLIPRLRRSPWASGALDGINAAALGLMAGVTVDLGRAALIEPVTVGLAVVALAALIRFRVNSAWIVLAGAAAGLIHALV